MPRRWAILIVLLPTYAFALMLAGTLLVRLLVSEDLADLAPHHVGNDMREAILDPSWWQRVGVMAVVFVALQFAFIIPLLGKKPTAGRSPKRLVISLVTAIVISGALLAAFAAALWDVARLYLAPMLHEDIATLVLVVFFLVSWCAWSIMLFIFTRTVWTDRAIKRLIGLLLGGTIVETVTVVPIDVMIRRKSDCYCFSGSFLSLCLAGFVLMWLAGPGFVLAMTAKKHRMWRERHCARCGYAKGPTPAERCPECGYAWRTHDATV